MSALNLDDFSDLIKRPDSTVRRAAEERRERLAVPPGALGRLDELGEWLAAARAEVPVAPVERPRVVLFAADHGVAGLEVSARPAGTAETLVRAVLAGEAPVTVLADRLGCRSGWWTWRWTAIPARSPPRWCATGSAGARA